MSSVSLQDESGFYAAVEQFLDENKPPVTCRKQMQGWTFAWRNSDGCGNGIDIQQHDTADSKVVNGKGVVVDGESEINQKQNQEQPTSLVGTLTWQGEYMRIHFETSCVWATVEACHSEGDEEKSCNMPDKGSFQFSCRVVRGEFACSTETQNPEQGGDKTQQKRIFNKVKSRLQKDSYIQKLLYPSSPLSVCEASIHIGKRQESSFQGTSSSLEERVHWQEPIVEAIRRAVFSQADSLLDVLELLLNFPWLPTTACATATRTTPLANRAKLRLLEDAMYDACEQEGEEELVQDLHIAKKSKTGSLD